VGYYDAGRLIYAGKVALDMTIQCEAAAFDFPPDVRAGQDSNFSKRDCCRGISNAPLSLCTESAQVPLNRGKVLKARQRESTI
jgi:hypothetical protein